MTKRNGNGSSDDGNRLASDSSSTRLYEEDFVEVQGLCVGGRKESEVIRELVRLALYARRYRQATKDPAFREMLRGFDDQVGVRLHLLEERLNSRLEADFLALLNFVGQTFTAANFLVREMRSQSFMLTPEDTDEAEFNAEWEKRLTALKAECHAAVRRRLEKRDQQVRDSQKEAGADSEGGGEQKKPSKGGRRPCLKSVEMD